MKMLLMVADMVDFCIKELVDDIIIDYILENILYD